MCLRFCLPGVYPVYAVPAEVRSGCCEPLHGCWEQNLSPLQEQPQFLTIEPYFQPQSLLILRFSIDILTLYLLSHEHRMFLLMNVTEFYSFVVSVCKSFTCMVNFIPKHFLSLRFYCKGVWRFPLTSSLDCSLLVHRNTAN